MRRKEKDSGATSAQPGKGRSGSLGSVVGGGRQGERPEIPCPVGSGERREGEEWNIHLTTQSFSAYYPRTNDWVAYCYS